MQVNADQLMSVSEAFVGEKQDPYNTLALQPDELRVPSLGAHLSRSACDTDRLLFSTSLEFCSTQQYGKMAALQTSW